MNRKLNNIQCNDKLLFTTSKPMRPRNRFLIEGETVAGDASEKVEEVEERKEGGSCGNIWERTIRQQIKQCAFVILSGSSHGKRFPNPADNTNGRS
jgi:hypothetical protein